MHAELADKGRADADEVRLKTSNKAGGWTEAAHVHANGIAVTSCPPSDSFWVPLSRSVFTRTLRTTESKRIVQELFLDSFASSANGQEKGWRNGYLGVWMVGVWCWHGMDLLEGAVVSAMRVAKALDVEIP